MSPGFRIERVDGRRGLQRFLEVPKRLYARDSLWVAPLDSERRRFFDPRRSGFLESGTIEMFVAVDDLGRDVARIAAIDNPVHNEFHARRTGFFGFFEAPDDLELARALVATTAEWARERGHDTLHGPVSPSTNHECGLLVSGFDDPPAVLMPYNPAYYEQLLLGAGLEPVKDLVALRLFLGAQVPERLLHAEQVLRRRHSYELRSIDMRRFEEEIAAFMRIYNEAWSENYGFVPMSEREMREMARDLRPIIDPGLAHVAQIGDEVVGVSLSIPDVNQPLRALRGRLFPLGWWRLMRGLKRIDRMRGLVLGVRPGYRKMGIDYALLRAGFDGAIRRGLREAEVSWMLADNVEMLRPLERIGLRETKRYRLYERQLG